MQQLPDDDLAVASVMQSLSAAQWGARWNASAGEPVIDMRYAPDEEVLLRPAPSAILATLLGGTSTSLASMSANYAVTDPFGEHRGAPVVSQLFKVPIKPGQLSFGAGVTALLHDLSSIVGPGLMLAPALVHSDLEVWAASRGSRVRFFEDPLPWDQVAAQVYNASPSVLHLDRPSFTGSVMALSNLERLLRVAADVGTIVIVDEGPATYLGTESSAVRLVSRVDNLVVLRGFTKAYSLGGLRAAFAIASPAIATQVRELLTPLQVGELALAAALEVLKAGDVFSALTSRICELKPEVFALLQSAGLPVLEGHPDLPWIAVLDEEDRWVRWLQARGIRPLLPTTSRVCPLAFRARGRGAFRLTIPLSEARMGILRKALASQSAAAPSH